MSHEKKTLLDKLRAFFDVNESPLGKPLSDRLKDFLGLNEEYINEYNNKLAETKHIHVDSIDYLSLSTEQKIAKIQTDIDDIKAQMNNLEDKIDFIIRIIHPNPMR